MNLDLCFWFFYTLLLPEPLPGEGGSAGVEQVRVDDSRPFLCPREAERGDHGQEDLVLHPREEPASGQQDQHRSQQTEQVCEVSSHAGLSSRTHKHTRARFALKATRVLGAQPKQTFNPHKSGFQS